MLRFETLKNIEEKLQARVKNLKIIEVAQHFNNPNLEIEMCETLLDIFNIVKNVQETRWARAPLKSNKNLSWIVSSKINPILSKTSDIGGTSLLDYDFIKNSIHQKSEKSNIENVAIFLQKQHYFGDSEKNALALLSETFFILVAHYSSNEKKYASGDGPYCLYCFRELYRFDTDTCDKHRDEKRTSGKRYFDRYINMKHAIRSYEYNNNLHIFD